MVNVQFDCTDEVLIATGAASGISRAVALAFANAGGRSIVLDITEPDAELTEHPNIEIIQLDVSDREGTQRTVDDLYQRYGRIDALLAGAAIQPRVNVLDQSPEVWQKVLDINLNGVVWISQAVAKYMTQQGHGSMLFFTSGLALNGYPQASAYAASKAALIGYGKSFAAEVHGHGVKVNIISPGVIDTPQFREANAGEDRAHWANTLGIGVPEDTVGPILFLLSEAATMTGSVLTREKPFVSRRQL